MGSCIKYIKSEEELNQNLKQNPHTGIIFFWKKCQHCHNTLQQIEQECRSLGNDSPVKVIACEVEDNPWCNKAWQSVKPANVPKEEYGVPVIIGVSQNNPIQKHSWQVIGEDPSNVQKNFQVLRQVVQRIKSQGNSEPSQETAQVQQNTHYQRMAPMYEWMAKMVSDPPIMQQMKLKANPSYQQLKEPLCLPPHCDQNTYKQRIRNFLLS